MTAAQGFLAERRHQNMPRGLPGLEQLRAWLESARREPPDEDGDHRFIEGAGALLAALLIEHFPGAHHVSRGGIHRVHLGARGCFDPFTAVEQVLEADDPRATFADAVGRAEAEATGSGPIARVVLEFERQLQQSRPELAVTEHFEHALWLGQDIEVDLRRVIEATLDADAEHVSHSVRRLIAALEADREGLVTWDDVKPRLFPRLIGASFASSLPGHGAQAGLHLEPLNDELRVAYILRYDKRARYVREDELSHWGRTPPELRRVAIDNLEGHSERTRWRRVETADGPLLVASTGDGLDAARLLLPALHHQLLEALQPRAGSLLLGIPHRDGLWACALESPALAQQLADRVAQDALRAPHSISRCLWLLQPGRPLTRWSPPATSALAY